MSTAIKMLMIAAFGVFSASFVSSVAEITPKRTSEDCTLIWSVSEVGTWSYSCATVECTADSDPPVCVPITTSTPTLVTYACKCCDTGYPNPTGCVKPQAKCIGTVVWNLSTGAHTGSCSLGVCTTSCTLSSAGSTPQRVCTCN